MSITVGAPIKIVSLEFGVELTLKGLNLGKNPVSVYCDKFGEQIDLTAQEVEKHFSYDRHQVCPEIIEQGKYECGAASLAILLGHTLFQVKRVLGGLGWRNDKSGVKDIHLREAARAFGRDLILGKSRTITSLSEKMPSCIVTVPSLNYPKAYHGVAWYQNQILDPNYKKNRKVYGPEWTPWTIGALNVLILAKQPIKDSEHKEIQEIRDKGSEEDIREAILAVAA
jgi:hypothetical protein